MKIVVRKSDNLIVLSGKNLFLDENKVSGDFICTEYNNKNSDVYEVSEYPEKYVDGAYKFINNEFVLSEDGQEKLDLYEINKKEEISKRENYQWDIVRKERNSLLAECDWVVLTDSPIENKQAWIEYRQALRDITLQLNPFEIIFPTKPI